MSEFPSLFSEDEIDRAAGHAPPAQAEQAAPPPKKPEPPAPPRETYPESALEHHHPRVVERLILFWGHSEFEPYVSSLTIDWRGGRQGFSPEVLAELFFLQSIHHERSSTATSGTPWNTIPKR